MRTDAELNQIARDLHARLIFSSQHVASADMIPQVFLAWSLMESADRRKLVDEGAAVLFEYLRKAGPLSVNGMPTFLSFEWVTADDWNKVVETLRRIEAAVAEAVP